MFLSNRSGNFDVWAREMASGKESALTSTSWDETHPLIAPDGSKVAYAAVVNTKPGLNLIPIRGGVAEALCVDCGFPLDWSPDGRRILSYWSDPIRYSAIDIITRERVNVIQHPRYNLRRPHYSPDGNGLAFHVPLGAEEGRSPIFIAPLRNGVALGENAWIELTDGSGIDAAPWWSPDGNTLYFLSRRDGFQSIWAQRLDAAKRPAGAPFAVAHFHGARHSVQESGFGPGIAADRLVFTLSESTGNIWMARPVKMTAPPAQ